MLGNIQWRFNIKSSRKSERHMCFNIKTEIVIPCIHERKLSLRHKALLVNIKKRRAYA